MTLEYGVFHLVKRRKARHFLTTTHTTRGRKNQGAKAPMLSLSYTFFILVMLGGLMVAIRVRPVGRGKEVEYTNIKNGRLIPVTQKPDTLMSRRTPDSVLEARERDCQSGWRLPTLSASRNLYTVDTRFAQ